jgi:GAF domain-containing protein
LNRARVREELKHLAQLQEPEAILDWAVGAALAVADAPMGNAQLFHPHTGSLELKAARGFDRRFMDYFRQVKVVKTACGLALVTRAPVVVPDIERSPVFPDARVVMALLEAGVRAVCSFPLMLEDGVVLGVLSVHYARPLLPRLSDEICLRTLVSQTARALACVDGKWRPRNPPSRPGA